MTVAAPPRRRAILLVAFGIVLAAAAGVAFLSSVVVAVDADTVRRTHCANNLKNVSALVQERRLSRRWPTSGSSGELVSLSTLGLPAELERSFVCPMDAEGRKALEQRSGSPAVDGRPEPFPCSYLFRDFQRYPVSELWSGKYPLLLCLHHGDEVQVCFDDSSVELLGRSRLGLEAGEPIKTGPDTKSELLRVFPPRPR